MKGFKLTSNRIIAALGVVAHDMNSYVDELRDLDATIGDGD